jgi:hypothetical protein
MSWRRRLRAPRILSWTLTRTSWSYRLAQACRGSCWNWGAGCSRFRFQHCRMRRTRSSMRCGGLRAVFRTPSWTPKGRSTSHFRGMAAERSKSKRRRRHRRRARVRHAVDPRVAGGARRWEPNRHGARGAIHMINCWPPFGREASPPVRALLDAGVQGRKRCQPRACHRKTQRGHDLRPLFPSYAPFSVPSGPTTCPRAQTVLTRWTSSTRVTPRRMGDSTIGIASDAEHAGLTTEDTEDTEETETFPAFSVPSASSVNSVVRARWQRGYC